MNVNYLTLYFFICFSLINELRNLICRSQLYTPYSDSHIGYRTVNFVMHKNYLRPNSESLIGGLSRLWRRVVVPACQATYAGGTS